MSTANPVEPKVEAAAAAVDAAASLAAGTPPVPAPASEGPRPKWYRNPMKLGLAAGSTALALAAGSYGWKYLTATPPRVAAQPDTPMAQGKGDDPPRPAPAGSDRLDIAPPPFPDRPADTPKPAPAPKLELDLPTVTLPDVAAPPVPRPDMDVPAVKAPNPAPRPSDTEPPPPVLPPANRPMDTGAPLVLPPIPGDKAPEPTRPAEADTFKAPDPLPAGVTDRKERPEEKESMPVIRIGGTQDVPTPPAPPKANDIPKIDVPPPPPTIDVPLVAPPLPKKDDLPKVDLPPAPKVDVPAVPTIDVPAVGPAPAKQDPPITAPTIRLPGAGDPPPVPIPNPMIPETPATTVPARVEGNVPTPPEKKDMYDEDWHTQRDGDTYLIISKEYYKVPDYAAALEAYNKERRKSGERIIRVPPTWVLEEQFPNLVGAKDPPGVEARTTSNPRFEPVGPRPGGDRGAPLPATASTSEEYRVNAEAGETIRDIARKVYGNPDVWRKLWDLNPSLDPTQPIPSGTILRLAR